MTTKTDLPSYADHDLFKSDPNHRSHEAPTFKRAAGHTEDLAAPVRELLDTALTAAGFDPTPALRREMLRRSAGTFGTTIVAMREAALKTVPDVGEALAGLIGTHVFTANEGPTPSNVTRCGDVYRNLMGGAVEPPAPEGDAPEGDAPEGDDDDDGDDD